jgi:glycosyltransferase involved in cell wall biosynthesis
MRAGCPVVATRVGGITDIVVHEETGLLVPPGDPAALTVAMESLLKNPVEARRMGEGGRMRQASAFSLDRMIEETLDVYQTSAWERI